MPIEQTVTAERWSIPAAFLRDRRVQPPRADPGNCRAAGIDETAREGSFRAAIAENGAYFLEGLQQLKSKHEIIGEVDGIGLALRIEICRNDRTTIDKEMMDWLFEEAMKGSLGVGTDLYGLTIDAGGYQRNAITLAPEIWISREEIKTALVLLDQLFERATKELSASKS